LIRFLPSLSASLPPPLSRFLPPLSRFLIDFLPFLRTLRKSRTVYHIDDGNDGDNS